MLTYTSKTFNVEYEESYLPSPRHRKLRYRSVQKEITVRIRTIDRYDTQLAFGLSDYSHISKHEMEILHYKGKLYIRSWRHLTEQEKKLVTDEQRRSGMDGYGIQYADNHHLMSPWQHNLSLKEIKDWYRKQASDYLYIRRPEGRTEVWEKCGEPRYMVMTFGLGHNHGGTSLFVETDYRDKISNENYSAATKAEEAIAHANGVAKARGDTKDIGRFEPMITVYMPELVKLNPKRQHGKGDPFLNQIDKITQMADSPLEAGLLTIVSALR